MSAPAKVEPMPRLLTVPEVAKILNCSKNHVYDLVWKKKIGTVHLGKRSVRFTPEAVERFIESRTTQVSP